MSEFFDHLPPALAMVAAMVAIVLGGGIAVLNFSTKWLDRLFPKSIRPAPRAMTPTTTDTVVVSASFADGQPIRDLIAAINALRDLMGDLRGCVRDGTEEQARTTASVARLGERVTRVADVLEDRLPHIRP